MELRLYRSNERTVRILETAFQNLQWNNVSIELPNVLLRGSETGFQKLQWNYVYIELEYLQCVC
jgi:hypothetical protein